MNKLNKLAFHWHVYFSPRLDSDVLLIRFPIYTVCFTQRKQTKSVFIAKTAAMHHDRYSSERVLHRPISSSWSVKLQDQGSSDDVVAMMSFVTSTTNERIRLILILGRWCAFFSKTVALIYQAKERHIHHPDEWCWHNLILEIVQLEEKLASERFSFQPVFFFFFSVAFKIKNMEEILMGEDDFPLEETFFHLLISTTVSDRCLRFHTRTNIWLICWLEGKKKNVCCCLSRLDGFFLSQAEDFWSSVV